MFSSRAYIHVEVCTWTNCSGRVWIFEGLIAVFCKRNSRRVFKRRSICGKWTAAKLQMLQTDIDWLEGWEWKSGLLEFQILIL